jgi:hypothetical protein
MTQQPRQVIPNVLRDQTVPNTLGGTRASPTREARRRPSVNSRVVGLLGAFIAAVLALGLLGPAGLALVFGVVALVGLLRQAGRPRGH